MATSSLRPVSVVIGAGLTGLATAYALTTSGHRVVVFERHTKIAQECSAIDGAFAAPLLSHPWVNPERVNNLWRCLWPGEGYKGTHISLSAAKTPNFRRFKRGMKEMAVTHPSNFRDNCVSSHRLAMYNARVMRDVFKMDLKLKGGSPGCLQLFDTREAREMALDKYVSTLRDEIDLARYKKIGEADISTLDPLLGSGHKHGIYTDLDSTADTAALCADLYQKCVTAGVTFRLNNTPHIHFSGTRLQVQDEDNVQTMVLCTGNSTQYHSLTWMPLDYIGLYPVVRYVIHVPLNPGCSVKMAVADEWNQIYIAPVENGRAVLVSGRTDFLPFADFEEAPPLLHHKKTPGCAKTLLQRAVKFYPPDTFDVKNATTYTTISQLTVDGLPIIGRSTKRDRVFYNCGHGLQKLSRVFGSAVLLRDVIDGKVPEIDFVPYEPLRVIQNWTERKEMYAKNPSRPPVTTPPPGTITTPNGELCFTGRAEDYDWYLRYKHYYDVERRQRVLKAMMNAEVPKPMSDDDVTDMLYGGYAFGVKKTRKNYKPVK